jgi:hypothetical protein
MTLLGIIAGAVVILVAVVLFVAVQLFRLGAAVLDATKDGPRP